MQPYGTRGWMHSAEADRLAIKQLWPELAPGQVERAARFLASQVALRLREMNAQGRSKSRRSWVHDY